MTDGRDAVDDGRLAHLERVLAGYGSAAVAFSGGVDSTLVAVAARRALPEDRTLAVIGVSASLADAERAHALALAGELGLRVAEVWPDELTREGYVANAGNRCYFCKSALFDEVFALAAARGLAAVCTGDNVDDLGDHRPGLHAARERGVRQPLIEAGLTKADVRELAGLLGLPNWDKPAAPCLSSRIPDGTRVDRATLARVERAEMGVRALGFRVFRVRHHGELGRLEVAAAEHDRARELLEPLRVAILGAGYSAAALDPVPFASGSLHRRSPLG